MANNKQTNEEKFNTIIKKNTFFFNNTSSETLWEKNIMEIINLLFKLKNELNDNQDIKKLLFKLIKENDDGLEAVTCLMGISIETLTRLISFIRIKNDNSLNKLVIRTKWDTWDNKGKFSEYKTVKIKKMVKDNDYFVEGIINLLLDGQNNEILIKNIPLFEFKRIGRSRLSFDLNIIFDTITRYGMLGSYSADSGKNAEAIIKEILKELNYSHKKGKLANVDRTMDFIIPDKKKPKIIIECSYMKSTSSGMSDKKRAWINTKTEILTNYPDAIFVGFIDGIGWYSRDTDLKELVNAFDYVFTYHPEELIKFKKLLHDKMN